MEADVYEEAEMLQPDVIAVTCSWMIWMPCVGLFLSSSGLQQKFYITY
jgi:hypothetical protein